MEISRFDAMLAREKATSMRKRPAHVESDMQRECIKWFRLKYPKYRLSLWAVGNGGRRDKRTGAIMKAEGVLAGVADLILFKPNSRYHAMCIEMKTHTGSQSQAQKEWQAAVEQDGYKYVVCRSFDDFERTVTEYLDN